MLFDAVAYPTTKMLCSPDCQVLEKDALFLKLLKRFKYIIWMRLVDIRLDAEWTEKI